MKKFLSLLLIIGLCTSCKQNIFITNDVNVQEINDVVLIEPQTEIGLITKGNNVFANDSLSDVASRNLEKILTYSEGCSIINMGLILANRWKHWDANLEV